MKRYFDLPEAKLTLMVEVKAGSPAALASPERIKDHFKQTGSIREIESDEYAALTKAYAFSGTGIPKGHKQCIEPNIETAVKGDCL